MRKIVISVLTFVVAVAIIVNSYFLFIKDKLTSTSSTQSDSAQTANTDSSSESSTASSSSTSTNASGMKDGTYTGSSTSTRWGDVQVQIVVKSGKINTVNVLSYPNENDKDKQINSQALPTYKQEALSAQSANIQLVSGASETYKGFTGSLQSAIDKAEA